MNETISVYQAYYVQVYRLFPAKVRRVNSSLLALIKLGAGASLSNLQKGATCVCKAPASDSEIMNLNYAYFVTDGKWTSNEGLQYL